jgi:hypothetical protein
MLLGRREANVFEGSTMSMLDQLPHTTSRIETFTPAGSLSIGTGFFFNFEVPGKGTMVTLITNKHVVRGANRARIYVSRSNGQQALFGQFNAWNIDGFDQIVVEHPSPDVDLAAFPVGGILSEMNEAGTPAHYRTFGLEHIPNDEDISTFTAIENILMIGYPYRRLG